jgi:hypothetical protein
MIFRMRVVQVNLDFDSEQDTINRTRLRFSAAVASLPGFGDLRKVGSISGGSKWGTQYIGYAWFK